MKKRIIGSGLIIITMLSLTLLIKPKEKEKEKITYEKTKNMLSYTIDGQPTKEKPSKGGSYIANKIECEKGTNIVWDNTNWTAEIKNVVSEDICNIDFTSNASAEGYRVTINSNNNSSMDSLSKATIKGGTIEFENTSEIKSVSGCTGKLIDEKLVIENVTSNGTCTVNVAETLYSKLLLDNPTHTGSRPNAFDGVYKEDNTGVMYVANGNLTEDGSNVYYFAGNALNNWVKFGQDSIGSDLYWRIIRTNEDKSVRLLYAGTSPDTTSGYIDVSYYNYVANDNKTNKILQYNPMGVGYMYGTSGSIANNRANINNSKAKITIDNWYRDGINTKTDTIGNTYDKYISQTVIYCNDRAYEGTYSLNSSVYYSAYYRLHSTPKNYKPSYKCGNDKDGNLYSTANNADKFSKNTSKGGNGLLKYSVALMTADEISFAGGANSKGSSLSWFYYNNKKNSITGNNWWWTMSPSFHSGGGQAFVYAMSGITSNGSALLSQGNVDTTCAVRPVLSLKSCITWKTGNGAWNTPYEVEINSTCALSEN